MACIPHLQKQINGANYHSRLPCLSAGIVKRHLHAKFLEIIRADLVVFFSIIKASQKRTLPNPLKALINEQVRPN